MRKKLISILLSLVLSIQLMPLTQIGAALYQNQFMEELPHSSDIPNPASLTEELQKHFDHWTYDHCILLSESKINEVIHHSEKLYSRLHEDVQIQPPDQQAANM